MSYLKKILILPILIFPQAIFSSTGFSNFEEEKSDYSDQSSNSFNESKFFAIVDKEFPKAKIDSITNQELILMIGNTGGGKSATIDTLLGHKMEEVGGDLGGPPSIRVKSPRDKHLPYAEIGETCISETTIPHLYVGGKESLSYVDCPGFDDTRGQEQAAFNTLMVRLFVEKSKCVKKIVCVVSKDDLLAKRGKVFVDLLIHLNKSLNGYVPHISKIFWIITKVSSKIEREGVIKHITKMKNEKLQNITSKMKESVNKNIFGQSSQEKMEKELLEAILDYPQNIFVIHPLDGGRTRRLILNALKKPSSSIPKSSFKIESIGMQDIKGTLETTFRRYPMIKHYNQYQFLSIEVFNKKKDLKKLDTILKDTNKNILDIVVITKQDEIDSIQKEVDKIDQEIKEMVNQDEEEILYRTISKKLESFFFGGVATINYNSHPFEKVILVHQGGVLKVIKEVPKKGQYNANYKLNANWKNIATLAGGVVIGGVIVTGVALAAVPALGLGAAATATASTATATAATSLGATATAAATETAAITSLLAGIGGAAETFASITATVGAVQSAVGATATAVATGATSLAASATAASTTLAATSTMVAAGSTGAVVGTIGGLGVAHKDVQGSKKDKAQIDANIYVKKKYTQQAEKLRKKEIIKTKKAEISKKKIEIQNIKDIKDKKNYSKSPKNNEIKQKGITLILQQQKIAQQELKKEESILIRYEKEIRKNKNQLHFIYSTYKFLYSYQHSIDKEIRNFAKLYEVEHPEEEQKFDNM